MNGKFYKEKILTQKEIYPKEFIKMPRKIKIEKNLFKWNLICGKSYLECNSEEEGRYLKVFIEAGMEKVNIPKDKKYLQGIVLDLEILKNKIDQIVDSYLESIINLKTKERLRHQIWLEIMS